MTPRRILLVDCDQFFVQCARLHDPDGVGRERLLLVGGSVAARGVVTSASYETRAFGVRSGMPTGQALRLCPQARVVPVPRSLCSSKSREIRTVLERFSPVVEPASIDEAYLDLSGTESLYRDEPLVETAQRIQAVVREETAIQVSIGGGTTKVVAKLATGRAKPAGVHIVPPGEEEAFLRSFQLADIPGVGPVFADELRRFGLVSVAEGQAVGEAVLAQWFGEGRGRWLFRRMRGIDEATVEPSREARSISRDETFPRDLHADADLRRELQSLTVRLGADLRREGLRARTVTVRIRDADFRNRQASRTLSQPLESDRAIFAVARMLLDRLRAARRTGARLLSVSVSQLLPATDESAQLALFDEQAVPGAESDGDRRLSRVADEIRDRFGPDAVKPASLLDT